MAGEFRKALFTVLVGETLLAAAAIVLSTKAREAARPYLVKGIRRALALGEEMKDMVEEAKLEPERVARGVEPEQLGTAAH